VPTLVLHGSADPEVSGEEVDRLMPALPDAELATLPAAGHMLPLTHTEVVVRQVLRWAERVRLGLPQTRPWATDQG
jgi:non-heme chloroperoxidase